MIGTFTSWKAFVFLLWFKETLGVLHHSEFFNIQFEHCWFKQRTGFLRQAVVHSFTHWFSWC